MGVIFPWIASLIGVGAAAGAGVLLLRERGRAARLLGELEVTRAESEGMTAAIEKERKARAAAEAHAEKSRAAEEEVGRLQAERKRLVAELEDARLKLKTYVEPKVAAGLHKELADKTRLLKEKTDDIGKLALEVQGLKAALTKATARPRPVIKPVDARLNVFQRLVARMGGLERVASAVLADDQGCIVASAGQHAEPLAAFGAQLARLAPTARDLLPLRGVQCLSVQDPSDMRVTVLPVEVNATELTLVTFGKGAEPDREGVQQVLAMDQARAGLPGLAS